MTMAIQHYSVDAAGHGTEWRVNPKNPCIVERKLPSGRWEIVRRCDTPVSARALLFQLAGRPTPQGK